MSDSVKTQSWTKEQINAISSKGKELLVAAGAGSGKTSVLTQRIVEKIIQGSDITNFLVSTFTSASAADMKEKIKSKLMDAYIKNPSNMHLSNQISKLPFAHISTMSSFCFNLVKQQFASLDLSPTVRIADESEADKYFDEAFEIFLDEAFSENNEDLLFILNNTSCMGSEERLREYLNAIYMKLRAHPNYIKKICNAADILSASVEEYKNGKPINETSHGKTYIEAAKLFALDIEIEADSLCDMGDNIGGLPKELSYTYSEILKKGKELLNNNSPSESISAYNSALAFHSEAWSSKKTFLGIDDCEKKRYNAIRTKIKGLIGKLIEFLTNIISDNIEELEKCVCLSNSMRNLIVRLDSIYEGIKKEAGVVDFTDCEQLTHKLLIGENGEPTQLAKELAFSFEEVLIDEYQDINPLQDAIVSSLATKNNRFMVGDDKQSIYRFRNAFPDIFNNYKASFNTETKECIFLRKNFRCSEEIIDFTNTVFNFLSGDAYKAEQLIFGKQISKSKIKPTVITINTTLSNKESSVYEGRIIAREILELKSSYIKENGEKLDFSDIAIIIPAMKNIGEILATELIKNNIPLASGKPGKLIEAPEIKLVLSILKAIENPHNDIPLASAMNSFFFGFSANDLVEIRKFKNSSLYRSVLQYVKDRKVFGTLKFVRKRKERRTNTASSCFSRRSDPELKKRCNDFIQRLSDLRYKSRTMECRQFIHMLYEDERLIYNIASGDDRENRRENLLLLYSTAINFGRREYKTLPAFLKYTDKLKTDAYSPNKTNGVSIITIHASKGLEFPVCFLANAGKNLTVRSPGIKKPIISIERGVFSPIGNDNLSYFEPLLFKAEEKLEKPEELEENKRRLYVALTRAREKLYVIGALSKIEKTSPHKQTNYLNWIHTAKPDADYIFTDVENIVSTENIEPSKEENKKTTYDNSSDTFFVYPYGDSSKIPNKLSVSQLKASTFNENQSKFKKTVKESDFLTIPRFAVETKKVSSTEIGTANHAFMQFSSFENVLSFGVEYEAQRLLLTDMITEEQYKMLNYRNLNEFFQSNLFKKIINSNKVFREKRFTIEDNSYNLLGIGNETVLVQGVIDIFFENPDGTFTVADYKTDRISEGKENILIQRYKEQLLYYSKAVESITKSVVSEKIIYSFSLGKEIFV